MKRLLALFLCLPLLTACSHTYLERQIYPICLSLDRMDDGRWQIGLQAPQSGSADNAAYDVLSALGDTPEDALRVLAASTPYPLNFSQMRLCLLSYEAAAAQPLRPLLRTLLELPSMRPNAYVMVSLGSALEAMSAQQPDFGMRLSTHLNLLFQRLQREKTLPDSSLSYCVRELGDARCDLLLCVCAVNAQLKDQQPQQHDGGGDTGGSSSPAFAVGEPWSDKLLPEDLLAGMLPRGSQNPVEYLGCAVVTNGRVTGVLNASQTQLALRVSDECRLRVAMQGDALQLQIITPRDGELAGHHDEIRSLMQTLQAMGSDPLTFGCIASMRFLTDSAWQAYDFRARYPSADVAVWSE